MRRKLSPLILIASLSLFALCNAHSTLSDPGGKIIGVEVGDWTRYNITVEYAEPPNASEFNPPDWARITITNVSEPADICYQVLNHFPNGSETTFNSCRSLTHIEEDDGVGWIISANLTKGDRIYEEYPVGGYIDFENLYINDTIVYDYPSGISRETHYSNFTENPPGEWYTEYSWYWDKLTGMTTKVVMEGFYKNGTSLAVSTVEMVDSNLFVVIPEFPSFLVLPLFMIATLLAVIIYRRKHST